MESKLPGAKMIYVDKANTSDRPGTTADQLAEDLVNQGAKMIFFTSDDMKDGAIAFAKAHPDIPVVVHLGRRRLERRQGLPEPAEPEQHHGPDGIRQDDRRRRCRPHDPDRQDRLPGPLINDETRRLAASVYLGAKYAWTEYLKKDPADLKFSVNWIGFWFNIPGVTSDPTQVADNFFNQGYDVVVSGIDTTEALVEAGKLAEAGKQVWAIPYDFAGALERGSRRRPGRSLLQLGTRVPRRPSPLPAKASGPASGSGAPPTGPTSTIPTRSAVGFEKGEGLSADASAKVDEFIKLPWRVVSTSGPGPLNLQDGSRLPQGR